MTAGAASARGRLLVRILPVAAAFIAVHLLTLSDEVLLAVAVVLFALFVGPAASALRGGGRWRLLGVLAAAALLIAAVSVEWPDAGPQAALIVPPFLCCLLVSAVFAHSLMPGQQPIITRMSHISRGPVLPDGLIEYTRLLTWGWAILPMLLGVSALVAFAAWGIEAWSWVNNVVSPLALVGYFVGEHIYRGIRHPHLGKPSILHTFDVMLNSMSWRR
jgi:uncharacterized membrane protein